MMRHFTLLATVVAFAVTLLAAAPAHAQATRTWVSGVGDDANPCSRTAPCKTFAGAISKTAAGGEINCLDPGGFGAVTVVKSMTISCETGSAGVLVSGTNGIVFNGAATDYLFLKGLDIEGVGTVGNSLAGIKVQSGGFLHVEDCVIRDFKNSSAGFGIQIAPNSNFKFEILRTTLFNNGTGATGAGIQVRPTAGATTGSIDHVYVDDNVFGIAADSSAGSSGINISVQNSTVNGNSQSGIVATGAVGVGVMVMNTAIVNNGTGLLAVGGGGVVRVGLSTITGNGTATSGNVLSYGNNQINGNGADTVPAGVPGGVH